MTYKGFRALIVANLDILKNDLVFNPLDIWYFRLTFTDETVTIAPLPPLDGEAPRQLMVRTVPSKPESGYKEERST